MWELDYKESWVQKNWCFWTVALEKTLESPLDCKEIQPVHRQLPEFTQTHVHWHESNSFPTISSSVFPFSCHLQSFPASGSFQMSQFFTLGGQSIGISASKSVLPMNIQLISFKMNWLDPLTVQETLKSFHQHHSLKALILCNLASSNCYIHIWLLEKP